MQPKPCRSETQGHRIKRSGARCIRNWTPTPNWEVEAERLTEWPHGWTTAAAELRETAALCNGAVAEPSDFVLEDLLRQRRELTVAFGPERRCLDRCIWRRRRHWRRVQQLRQVEQAAENGRAPPGARPSLHVNWTRICSDGAKPEDTLTAHVEAFYKLEGQMQQEAAARRTAVTSAWAASDHKPNHTFDLDLFGKALRKLRQGNGSPQE